MKQFIYNKIQQRRSRTTFACNHKLHTKHSVSKYRTNKIKLPRGVLF